MSKNKINSSKSDNPNGINESICSNNNRNINENISFKNVDNDESNIYSDTSHKIHNQFIAKYSPKKISEIVGQGEKINYVKNQIINYKKAILIYGPPGVGKTSSAYALANELNLEIIEVNASDSRNTDSLEIKLFPAIKQKSLFNKGKLILIDEIDGISGNQDRGGLQSIIKIIEYSKYPIILTANNPWDQKFNSLRNKVLLVEYTPISIVDIFSFLKKICKIERIQISEDALKFLSRKSQGDLRAALNDLENIAFLNKNVGKKDIEEISDREREESITNSLLKVFKTKDPEVALSAFNNLNEDIETIFLWLEENIIREYSNVEDFSKAYEELSLADVFYGRIKRNQYYRFYAYIYDILSVGVALSKKEKYPFVNYSQPKRLLNIWISNQKNLRRKSISEKIARVTHCSIKESFSNIPYIKVMARDEKFLLSLSKELKLDSDEIDWLKK